MVNIAVVIHNSAFSLETVAGFYKGFEKFLPLLLVDNRFVKVLAADIDSARAVRYAPSGEMSLNINRIYEPRTKSMEAYYYQPKTLFVFTDCLKIHNMGQINPPPIEWR
jgi:hypothetical protein